MVSMTADRAFGSVDARLIALGVVRVNGWAAVRGGVVITVAGTMPCAAAAIVPTAVTTMAKVHDQHAADQQDPQPVGGEERQHCRLLRRRRAWCPAG